MKSDFELIVDKFSRDDIEIYPFGDVHIGSRQFMREEVESFLSFVMEKPNRYLVIVGDLMDYNLKNSVGNPFDEVMRPQEQKEYAYKLLEPVKDRILCGVSGNHEARGVKEADSDPLYDVFCWLHIQDRYRPNIAFLKLRFGDRVGDAERNPTYCVAVTHGSGGGGKKGASVNKLDDFCAVLEGVDILITGHTHSPLAFPSGKLSVNLNTETIKPKQFEVCVCSSWLDYGGYALRAMMKPSAHKVSKVNICGKRKEFSVTI